MDTASDRNSCVHFTKNWIIVGCAPALADRASSSRRDQGAWGVLTPKYGARGFRNTFLLGTGGCAGGDTPGELAAAPSAVCGPEPAAGLLTNAGATSHSVRGARRLAWSAIQSADRQRSACCVCLDSDQHCPGEHRAAEQI